MNEPAECEAWLNCIGEGGQFGSGFVDINPDSKSGCSGRWAAQPTWAAASSCQCRNAST
jgi:hypothetical protein